MLNKPGKIKLEPGECLSSYDVSALFTSVPIDPTLNIIKDLLDTLEFCLKNTYFSFQSQFYEQVEGAAMGSLVSLIVANLYMEYLEQKALSTAPTPKFWCRYVDDTFVIHKEVNKQGFLQHINRVDPAIRFTVEDNKEDGSIPFLDTIVKPQVDGSLSITVYRKPTHTDQYLQWDSHHHLSAKFSVIQTLSHRACTVCNNPELLQKEKEHIRRALTNCKYPKWALDKVEKRLNRSSRQVNDGAITMPSLLTMECKIRVTLSYPTHKVFVKVSKRSVVGMASKLTSKVAEPSKTFWSPPRTKTQWSTKVVSSIGTNVAT